MIFQVNQKMMKSALIKDLYFEMDRLKQGMFFLRSVPEYMALSISWKHDATISSLKHMLIISLFSET